MNAVAKELLEKTRQLSEEDIRPVPASMKIHVEYRFCCRAFGTARALD